MGQCKILDFLVERRHIRIRAFYSDYGFLAVGLSHKEANMGGAVNSMKLVIFISKCAHKFQTI